MAKPVRPGTGTPRRTSALSKPAKQIGTVFADPIRASSRHPAASQAGQKTAPDQRVTASNQLLQCGSHPKKTFATGSGLAENDPKATFPSSFVALLLCQCFRPVDLADCRGIVDREPTEFVPSNPAKRQAPPQWTKQIAERRRRFSQVVSDLRQRGDRYW